MTGFSKKALIVMSLAAIVTVASVDRAAANGFGWQGVFLSPVTVHSSLIEVSTDEVNVGARKFIENMGEKAIGFLSDDGLEQTQKEAEFRKLLRSSFDMATIGRFSLGRYWSVSTSQQQSEYQKLFEDMVVEVYARRFNDYHGHKFDVRGSRSTGENDTLVTSFILPQEGSEIQVDWRVRNKNGTYKIIDVIIEGVSMSMTQRSDFSSVIQRGGGDVQVLLAHLRQQ